MISMLEFEMQVFEIIKRMTINPSRGACDRNDTAMAHDMAPHICDPIPKTKPSRPSQFYLSSDKKSLIKR